MLWLNEINFYKEELKIFNKRFEDIVVRYTDKEVLAELEKFQNQFIRQAEVVDEISHKVRKHEQELAKYAEENPVAIDHVHFEDHKELREEFETFVKIYQELKAEYTRFLAKYM